MWQAVDQHQDGGSGVGSADADVVQSAVVAEAEFAVGCPMMSRRTRACGSVLGEVARGGFGPGLIGSRGGAAAEGAVRPAAVVVGGELVAEGLQFGQGLGLPRLRSEPFLQRLLEPFHFAAGGGVVRPGVLLDHTQMAEFGLEAVDGVASGAAAGEAGGAKIPPQWGDYPCNKR